MRPSRLPPESFRIERNDLCLISIDEQRRHSRSTMINRGHAKRLLVALTAVVAFVGASFAPRAMAQSAPIADNAGAALEEIVVTASKRVSTVQDTPISITAVSGERFAGSRRRLLGLPGPGHARRFAEERRAESDGDRDARHDLERRQLRDGRLLSR